MNIFLWIVQIVLGIYFILTGFIHFTVPPNLPGPMQWMYEFPAALHYIIGAAELLGGLGLILLGVIRIQTQLIPLAAAGLFIIMLGAIVYHLTRGEYQNTVMNLILSGAAAFVAYGRLWFVPLTDRSEHT